MSRNRVADTHLRANPAHPTDPLASDLRTLAGLRSRTAVRDRTLPALDELLPDDARHDPDGRFAARTTLVDAAVEAVHDHAHREAARCLLASGGQRWRPLKARGGDAGALFGCGWDAYRRRRTSGPSLLDETVAAVAEALRSFPGLVADQATDAGPTVDDLPRVVITPPSHPIEVPPTATDRRPSRVPALAGAFAVAAIAVAGVVTFAQRGSGTSTEPRTPTATIATPTCGALDYAIGDLPADADPTLTAWGPRFRDHADADPSVPRRCAAPIVRSGPNVIQLVNDGDSYTSGALLGHETPDGEIVVVTLSRAEAATYNAPTDEDGPGQGRPRHVGLGELVGRDDAADGTQVVRFGDGALVRDRVESPSFPVTGRWHELWLEQGGLDGPLGRPVTWRGLDEAEGLVQQHFTGGVIAASTADADPSVVVTTEDPALRLPDGHRNAILVEEPFGTSWYVDPNGVRHWIHAPVHFRCAEQMNIPIHDRVPPAAVAALEPGESYRCP